MKNQKFLVSLLFVSLLSLPALCFGAGDVSKLIAVLNNVIDTATTIIWVVCALMILYGGVIMLISQGSPDKVSSGKQIIVWAIMGAIVAALARTISEIVAGVM